MKLLICGHAQHGKDSVADLLCDFNAYTASSSSFFVIKKLEKQMCKDLGLSTAAEVYEKRSLHRQYLYEIIRDYNSPDKARLSKEILNEHQIYVGMRDLEEFNASKHLYDLKIWVDASGRGVPLEPITSFNIPKDEFDVIIENNGSFDLLVRKVANLAKSLKDTKGKIIGEYCDGFNLCVVRSDGNGGTIVPDKIIQYNSVRCGYQEGISNKITMGDFIRNHGYSN
jgi:hypothetical protein